MIIFYADGRLGNQIFQYAFLKTIAKENEKIVSINMTQLKESFEIEDVNFIEYSFGNFSNLLIRKILRDFFLKLFVLIKLISCIKQDRNKTSSLLTCKKTTGLLPITFVETNYFQSQSFFDPNKLDISLKEIYLIQAKKFLSKVCDKKTKVFIHLRLGDYLSETYLGVQGINLPKNYFLKAIDIIKSEIKDPYFVILSDDPNIAEKYFFELDNKIISRNTLQVDLAIMSLCRAGICSNSSFSWWGAFLMDNKIKVVMPKYWFGWKLKVESHIGIQPYWSDTIDF
jgi:hypothetical protein